MCEEFPSVHSLILILTEKSSFSKPIDSVFSPPPLIIFSCKCSYWVYRDVNF